MPVLDQLCRPTLLLDRNRCLNNIKRMAEKAHSNGVRFRPHFKTHQSAEIGAWFRPFGVEAITVSSVDMAGYFAKNGWQDITIAFPVNWRQLQEIRALARQVHLGLLVDSLESARFLAQNLTEPADIWIEADAGQHRSGIPSDQIEVFCQVAEAASTAKNIFVRGILAHAGQTYHAASLEEIGQIYTQSVENLSRIRDALIASGLADAEISWGDTPSCSMLQDLSSVDEIRPGNFVFYDITQLHLGVCREDDLAVALACPVVSKPGGDQLVVYGGAVHLSKEALVVDGQPSYGDIAFVADKGWGSHLPGAKMVSLSQEHGVGKLLSKDIARINLGDVIAVLPIHSCLTVDLMPAYLTLDGEWISMMEKFPGV